MEGKEPEKFTSPYNHRCIHCQKDTLVANFREEGKQLVIITECRPCNTIYRVTFAINKG